MTPPTSHRRFSAAGFTLVELLAVLILLGIGVAVAVPRMGGMNASRKTYAALGGLRTDLGYARVLAVRWGRPTSVRLAASGTSYTVTVDTAGTAAATFRQVKEVRMQPGVRLAFPDGKTQISFTSRGLAPSDAGVFTAVSGAARDSIRLYSTGRVESAN